LTLPVVAPLTDLTRLLATQPELVLADPEGPPLHAGARAVVIGPEGGFSADELATARTGSLPGNVLRAETAAIVAATVVCGYRDAFFEAHR
jgi:RsmE family RNA methyltransferase